MARAMVRATAKAMEDRLHNAAGNTPGGVHFCDFCLILIMGRRLHKIKTHSPVKSCPHMECQCEFANYSSADEYCYDM